MTSKVIYTTGLNTQATHLASGTIIETDAPVDNNGKGEKFSPTDLVATALASCMATIMGIAANTHGYNIDGMQFDVTKVMTTNPRRIGEIIVEVFPNSNHSYNDKARAILEKAALTCPVLESLHPDCKKTVTFHW